jgi:hypothetical protein
VAAQKVADDAAVVQAERDHGRQHGGAEKLEQQVGQHVLGRRAHHDQGEAPEHLPEAAREAARHDGEGQKGEETRRDERDLREHERLDDSRQDLPSEDRPQPSPEPGPGRRRAEIVAAQGRGHESCPTKRARLDKAEPPPTASGRTGCWRGRGKAGLPGGPRSAASRSGRRRSPAAPRPARSALLEVGLEVEADVGRPTKPSTSVERSRIPSGRACRS